MVLFTDFVYTSVVPSFGDTYHRVLWCSWEVAVHLEQIFSANLDRLVYRPETHGPLTSAQRNEIATVFMVMKVEFQMAPLYHEPFIRIAAEKFDLSSERMLVIVREEVERFLHRRTRRRRLSG